MVPAERIGRIPAERGVRPRERVMGIDRLARAADRRWGRLGVGAVAEEDVSRTAAGVAEVAEILSGGEASRAPSTPLFVIWSWNP